ncbi:MAG TPA: PrgI family protein [Candidatus Levybacteria bacterium]|nr:PrgI family protein [Candidatus Levybacteria bacterium]
MENHPIPQDVTGFKFKIIGSMTVKQFGYIIAAGIFCTITFVLPLEGIVAIIKIPMMALFAGVGFALAFIPVGGRPLDKMLVYFATSIPKENQFVYHKQGVDLSQYEFLKPTKTTVQPAPVSQEPKNNANRTALASALRNSYFRPDEEELQYLTNLKSSFDSQSSQVTPTTPSVTTQSTISTPAPVFKKREVINPAAPVQPIIKSEDVKAKIADAPVKAPEPKQKVDVAEITKEIQEIKTAEQTVGQTAELEAKIKDLEQKLAQALGQTAQYQQHVLQQAKQTSQTAVTATEKQAAPSQNVKSVSANTQLDSGFPTIPDVPNIVLGIVKDPRGKVLQNILVEVVDTNEIPVRAFKTNALGQFISATPLPNGTFKMYFDDPGKMHEFETVQIEMKGEIFNPIEITSVDQREKLRRDLFGSTPIPGPNPAIATGI